MHQAFVLISGRRNLEIDWVAVNEGSKVIGFFHVLWLYTTLANQFFYLNWRGESKTQRLKVIFDLRGLVLLHLVLLHLPKDCPTEAPKIVSLDYKTCHNLLFPCPIELILIVFAFIWEVLVCLTHFFMAYCYDGQCFLFFWHGGKVYYP